MAKVIVTYQRRGLADVQRAVFQQHPGFLHPLLADEFRTVIPNTSLKSIFSL
ncbi:hypothetical protein [Paenibacillus elgii]|uniref:hypothetical protein n=1 Tax=Paenibacillus elgii TaxID=189691 RepID=UPI0002ECA549|nr:hypothetical protein [Paenibacillus elgii]